MRKLYCTNLKCEKVLRSKEKFKSGMKCPDCGGELGIRIKGDRDIQLKMPEGNYVTMAGHSTIPRRCRPYKKGGVPKSDFPKKR